jgi:hypothetical protein
MTRQMIDTTHAGLPIALPFIEQLPPGSLVGLYDTGSSDIIATMHDILEIPVVDHVVLIDQGFTGSPNLAATVRDCEQGAWSIKNAVVKTGWNVPRPTLYLGFPNTAQQAFNAGWRGDVWLVRPTSQPPTMPPTVPKGLNVVAVQWGFDNPAFDRSVVFDDSWPLAKKDPPMSVKVTTPPPLTVKEGTPVIAVGIGPQGKLLWVTTTLDGHNWSPSVSVPLEIPAPLRSKRNNVC